MPWAGVVTARRICWPLPVPRLITYLTIPAFILLPALMHLLRIMAESGPSDLSETWAATSMNARLFAPVVAALLVYEVLAWFPRRSGRLHAAAWWSEIAAAPPLEVGSAGFTDRARELAALTWVSDRCERHDPRFDADMWFQLFPPGMAPRLIVYDLALPPREDFPEAFEDVDVGPERRIGMLERQVWKRVIVRASILILLIYGGGGALLALFTGISMSWILALGAVPLIAELILIWWVQTLFRRGHRPMRLQATVASVGRVERTVYGRQRDFSTDDSVLIIEPSVRQLGDARAVWRQGFDAARADLTPKPDTSLARGLHRVLGARVPGDHWPVRATLVRRDGKRLTLKFFSGPEDPGLLDLLCRWTADPQGAGSTAKP